MHHAALSKVKAAMTTKHTKTRKLLGTVFIHILGISKSWLICWILTSYVSSTSSLVMGNSILTSAAETNRRSAFPACRCTVFVTRSESETQKPIPTCKSVPIGQKKSLSQFTLKFCSRRGCSICHKVGLSTSMCPCLLVEIHILDDSYLHVCCLNLIDIPRFAGISLLLGQQHPDSGELLFNMWLPIVMGDPPIAAWFIS